jgi:tight adherence protein B
MNALIVRLVVLIAIFGSVFLVSQIFLASTMNRRAELRAVNKRLKLLGSGRDRNEVVSILKNDVLRRPGENAGPVERTLFRFQQMVRTAGVSTDPRMMLFYLCAGVMALFALLLFLALKSPFPVTSGVVELVFGVAVAVAVGLPIMILSRMAQRRRKRMEEQFPLALDVFTRALRAGHPIAAAIDLLAQEVEDPLGSEFGLVADEVAYGAELEDALLALADRWELDDIRMFVISLSVQNETGGNLAEVLENLTKVIRDRAALYMKVRALSSEGRMSGWMLTVLPVLTFISMFLVSPQFYFKVAGDPIFIYGFTGLIILYFIGVIIIRRMIDLEV